MGDTTLVKLSHLMATFRSVDVIANNIANASTPGYKRDLVQFA